MTSSLWPRPALFLSFLYIEEEPPPPRSTPWGAYRSAISCGAVPASMCLQNHMFTYFTHSYQVGRSMVVGHIPIVHTCSLMCNNHIDMKAHNQPFNELGSTLVMWLSHLCQYCPWWDLNSQHSDELLGEAWLVQRAYPFGHTTSPPHQYNTITKNNAPRLPDKYTKFKTSLCSYCLFCYYIVLFSGNWLRSTVQLWWQNVLPHAT